MLARARTGSGKTAAYCVPAVQRVLEAKQVNDSCSTHGAELIGHIDAVTGFGRLSGDEGGDTRAHQGVGVTGHGVSQKVDGVL